ncbi:MAG: hypothetical protein WBN75_19475 [Verrucomicrobiia bacterium]
MNGLPPGMFDNKLGNRSALECSALPGKYRELSSVQKEKCQNSRILDPLSVSCNLAAMLLQEDLWAFKQ